MGSANITVVQKPGAAPDVTSPAAVDTPPPPQRLRGTRLRQLDAKVLEHEHLQISTFAACVADG